MKGNHDRFREANRRAGRVPESIDQTLARLWRVLRDFPEAREALAAEFPKEEEDVANERDQL